MTRPFVLHGDTEALAVEVLQEHTPELDSFTLDGIATDLRGYDSTMRWIMVTTEGGATTIENVINKPRLDITVRAERRDVAHDIAAIAFASFFRNVPISGYGATITDVRTELGLTNVPDQQEEESYRYLFSLRLTCTANPDSAPGAQS